MNRRHRGLTMLLALGSMALVTVAVVTLAESGMRETRSVGRRIQTDQIDQLLMASIISATQRANASPLALHERWTLPLPAGLNDATVAMEATYVSADDASIAVTVRLGEDRAEQTLHLHRHGRWIFASAELQ